MLLPVVKISFEKFKWFITQNLATSQEKKNATDYVIREESPVLSQIEEALCII